jgi:molecular chaperone GrpE
MKKTVETDPELDKHEDSAAETPPMQQEEIETPESKPADINPVKAVQDELAEAKDKYVRLYAEFENHRRRTAKEKLEMIQGANEQLLKSLLPVLDDFERAGKSIKDSGDKSSEGFLLIQNKFKKTLEQYGVKPMSVEAGSAFDADLQEAITQVSAGDEMKGKVVDVVEKGYLLNDKVIRFAKVVIGS